MYCTTQLIRSSTPHSPPPPLYYDTADLEANEDNTPVEMECAEESPLSDLSGYSYTVHRSRLLLLRSSVAAVTTVMAQVPSFFHPYILRTLSSTLSLRCIDSNRKKPDSDLRSSEDSSKKSKFMKKKTLQPPSKFCEGIRDTCSIIRLIYVDAICANMTDKVAGKSR